MEPFFSFLFFSSCFSLSFFLSFLFQLLNHNQRACAECAVSANSAALVPTVCYVRRTYLHMYMQYSCIATVCADPRTKMQDITAGFTTRGPTKRKYADTNTAPSLHPVHHLVHSGRFTLPSQNRSDPSPRDWLRQSRSIRLSLRHNSLSVPVVHGVSMLASSFTPMRLELTQKPHESVGKRRQIT